MTFSFKPKSEAEIAEAERIAQEARLWPKGEYPFEIISAFAKMSKDKFDEEGNLKKAGSPMIEMKVNIYKEDGSFQQVFDFLMESFAHKLRHCAYACGLGADYESGQLDPLSFKNKTGIAKVGISKANGNYSARNQIEDYVVDAAASVQATATKTARAKKEAPAFDDSIPF